MALKLHFQNAHIGGAAIALGCALALLAVPAPWARAFEQRCSYDIDVRHDPAHRLLTGSERITYINNADVSLSEVYRELFPNLETS